jgi:hypothetical protein
MNVVHSSQSSDMRTALTFEYGQILLVPQGNHGIDARGTAGGDVACE